MADRGGSAYWQIGAIGFTLASMSDWVRFDWDAITGFRRHHLPHVIQPGVVYFVTFRLNDSIPANRLAMWKQRFEEWLALNPPSHDYQQLQMAKDLGFRRIEKFLNGGHGSSLLRDPECRGALQETLNNRDGQDYLLGNYAIMPNHVHVIVKAMRTVDLAKVIGAWKSVSAHRINKVLGREGSMWQDEWFDHIVRSPEALVRTREYVQQNPHHLPASSATTACGSFK